MSPEEIRQLLLRRESETLDFKRDPYPFYGASDTDRAPMVKDILAMANAWRDAPAYILIGIDENGPSVVGIPPTDRFNDADLQQLLDRGRFNRPLRMRYERVQVDGKIVGVVEISTGVERPIYLQKAYGKLPAGVVYVRRGSTNSEAGPDEIARMGKAEVKLRAPKLSVAFADPESRNVFGVEAFATVDVVSWPKKGTPAWERLEARVRAEQEFSIPKLFEAKPKPIRQRFKEMVETRGRFRLGLAATNEGTLPARDVQVSLLLPANEHFRPVEIRQHTGAGHVGRPSPTSSLAMEPTVDGVRFRAVFPKLHAGDTRVLDAFIVVEATRTDSIRIPARIFSDDLPSPEDVVLTVHIQANRGTFVIGRPDERA